jgi:hypothetical protein
MKVFVFRPSGHGESTFSVLAENYKEAINYIEKYIERQVDRGDYCSYDGWGTDYYKVEIHDTGEVFENAND